MKLKASSERALLLRSDAVGFLLCLQPHSASGVGATTWAGKTLYIINWVTKLLYWLQVDLLDLQMLLHWTWDWADSSRSSVLGSKSSTTGSDSLSGVFWWAIDREQQGGQDNDVRKQQCSDHSSANLTAVWEYRVLLCDETLYFILSSSFRTTQPTVVQNICCLFAFDMPHIVSVDYLTKNFHYYRFKIKFAYK